VISRDLFKSGLIKLENLMPQKKGVVGLDIGSSSLKLVEISDSSSGYILNRFSHIPLPKGVISGGLLLNPAILTEKIKELYRKSGCRCKKVVTSLSGHTIIVKKATFPISEESDLRALLGDEGEKYLPFDDIKEVNFDFNILGPSDVMPGHMDVMLAAAKKEVVNSYATAIENAGLTTVIMDIDPFALETMYEANYEFEENDIDVLVNIGASITNINVLKHGGSIFTRDFAIGGDSVTESIQKKLGIEFDEAEKIKIEASQNEHDPNSVSEDIINHADPIILEIERSVDYFRSTYNGEYIKKVFLSGGSAKIPGLLQALSQRLNIETELANPFRKIRLEKSPESKWLESIAPTAALAVGLSLRRENDR
jgi:type IV pilus assembly protein PilM